MSKIKKKKIERMFHILNQKDCYSRQRGEILNNFFLNGKCGLLYLEDWMRLHSMFKNFYTRKKIISCVRGYIRNGHVLGREKSTQRPFQRFLSKIFS